MHCLKKNVIDVCAAEANPVCAGELNVLEKAVCAGEANLVCAGEAPSIKTGHVGVKKFYLAQKAMYSLRQSPRCWGLHRDSVLRKMRSKEGHRFVQADAEPNLWSIIEHHGASLSIMEGQGTDDDRDEWLVGFLLVYIDDLKVASDPATTNTIIQVLQDEWETSTPEVVGEKKVKFLGMELTRRHKVDSELPEKTTSWTRRVSQKAEV